MKRRAVDVAVEGLRSALVEDRAVRLWRAMSGLWFTEEDSPFAGFIEATEGKVLTNGDEIIQRVVAANTKPKPRMSPAGRRRQIAAVKAYHAKRRAQKRKGARK